MTRFEFYLNLNKYKDKQDEKSEENSLKHYGTLGQKWGVRKWQNYDGTFNEAGKERYFGKNGTTKIGSSDKKMAKLTKKANNMLNTMYDNMDPETIKKQQDYMNNFSLNVNVNPGKEQKVGGNFWNQTKARTFMNITDQGRVKHIKKYADYFDIDGLSDEDILKVVRMTPEVDPYNTSSYADRINSNLYKYKVNNAMTRAANTYSDNNQKVGAMGIYDIAAGVISVKNAINNYDDVQALRKSYGDFMDSSDKDYSDNDRSSIMNNKKKIAQMQEALENNDQEKYNKLLKKVKGKDMEAVKKFLEDYNEKNNKTSKMPEDTQEKLEESVEKLGSISKPKVPKKYLNEDGTLNDRGKQRAASNRKASDVASSVFLALRNFNLFELASLPVAGAVLALSGFGIPAVLGTAIAGAVMAPGIAIDNALYKKLEKRADAYYNMLSK